MSSHNHNVIGMAEMHDRMTRALNLMEQMTRECEGKPNWSFLQSRARDLEARIAALCEDTQVQLFDRHGFYARRAKGAA